MGKLYYHVKPRYTSGSPAMVDERIARQVVKEEQEEYKHCLEGLYGEEHKLKAMANGLHGIAYTTREVGNTITVTDLITGEVQLKKPYAKRKQHGS